MGVGKKVFAFYFCARWWLPCLRFTPQLAEWYKNGLKDKGLEIVFVSSDKTQEAFDEYFSEMPWLALDYQDRKLKKDLKKHFGVHGGHPSVVIIDADGSIISKDGCGAISSDPTGEEFPWYPKPVFNLKACRPRLDEGTFVIAMCEGGSVEDSKRIEAAMTPLAAKFVADAKAAGEERPEICFALLTEKAMGSGIRSVMSLGEPTVEPQLIIIRPGWRVLRRPSGGHNRGCCGQVGWGLQIKIVGEEAVASVVQLKIEGQVCTLCDVFFSFLLVVVPKL